MLKDRAELEKSLINVMVKNMSKQNSMTVSQGWYMELLEKYNIPITMSSDIISQRKDLSEFNEFILYCITDVIYTHHLKEYFTDVEIKLYREQKFETDSIKFPIRLHLIEVNKDQYIGKTSAQFLMQLREKQMINYNADTQRALKIMLKGGTKILRPYVDDTAVGEIEESYNNSTFIPNVITLNINLDDENADYSYDDKTETLIIKNITAFDIVDGYHRYLGMGRNFDKNNSWDYPMILQITMFSVGKAKQFIFQENHKTKMKEIDAATYDQHNDANYVVERLNSDTTCHLHGQINLTSGNVNAGVLSRVIGKLYFPKKVERKEVIATFKIIQQGLNNFVEEYDEFLDRKWHSYDIITIMYGIRNDYTPAEIYSALNKLPQEQKDILSTVQDINLRIEKILKEVY